MPSNVEGELPEDMVSKIVDSPQSASVTPVDLLTHHEVGDMKYKDAEMETLEAQVKERREYLLALVEQRIERERLMDVYQEFCLTKRCWNW